MAEDHGHAMFHGGVAPDGQGASAPHRGKGPTTFRSSRDDWGVRHDVLALETQETLPAIEYRPTAVRSKSPAGSFGGPKVTVQPKITAKRHSEGWGRSPLQPILPRDAKSRGMVEPRKREATKL